MAAEAEPGDGDMAEAPDSPSRQGPGLTGEGEQAQVKLLVNEDGRYVCMLCHKTFKTVSLGAACWPGRAAHVLGAALDGGARSASCSCPGRC